MLKRLEKLSIRFADLSADSGISRVRNSFFTQLPADKIKVVIIRRRTDLRFRRGNAPEVTEKNGNGSNPFVILYHGSLVRRNGFDWRWSHWKK